MGFGNENVRVRMEGDKLSSLPDEIIHHILSFGDTKYAVQTSVLSSRWRLLWTTLPYLKFSTYEFCTLPKFSKFVNQVLSCRNDSANVSSVDLIFRGPANQKFLQKIANYAVSHNVQSVNIFAFRHKAYDDHQFPLCFFTSQSLQHLSIKTDIRTPNFPLPHSPWDCTSLTSIELKDLWLCAKNVVSLDLFSKCVSLINLTLSRCWGSMELVKILCPRLVCLTISCCSNFKYEIMAPNLSYFHYDDMFQPLVLSTCNLNSLEKVNLMIGGGIFYFHGNESMRTGAHEFMNMLHQLRNAKFVTLDGSFIEEVLSKVFNSLEHRPSPLCNLKCLSIKGLKRPKTTECDKLARTQKVIDFLLNSSPSATVSITYRKVELSQRRRTGLLFCRKGLRTRQECNSILNKSLVSSPDVGPGVSNSAPPPPKSSHEH